jgi:cytoskeletal protein CcmA (bactofilin family)
MWRRTDEVKPSSPGANTTEPDATIPNSNLKEAPAAVQRAEISSSPVPAPPAAAAFRSAATPDVAAAISSVSTIGPGLKIRGDISGDCHLIVEGEAHGKIHLTNGRVTVGADGRVNADITAPEIAIEGSVQGNLQARDNVRLGPASHVQGSVLTPRIRIEDGARFRGKVEMTRPGDAAISSAIVASPSANDEIPKTAIVGAPRG